MRTVLELVEMNYILSLGRERSGAKNEMHRIRQKCKRKENYNEIELKINSILWI